MSEQNFSHFIAALQKLEADLNDVTRRVTARATAEAYGVTVENTPVGEYSPEVHFFTRDGKEVRFTRKFTPQGGTLKSRWDMKPVKRTATGWSSGYSNNTEYALWVNDGHRIVVDGVTIGWVPGQFFLEKGLDHARRNMQQYFREELNRVRGKW